MLTSRVRAWEEAGRRERAGGHEIFVMRRRADGPAMLWLHGFPSSSYDFKGLLGAHPAGDVLTFDFLGFGLSDKPRDHTYSLFGQADLAEELVARAGFDEVFLLAHDMGTSVATELLARDIEGKGKINLRGALLFNGSMLLDRASLTPAQKLLRSRFGAVFARLSNERSFRLQFGRLFSKEHPLTAEEAADQWSLIAHGGGAHIAHKTIYYLGERERLTDRWHGAIRDWPGKLSLAWGLEDPVATTAVLNGLRELRPGVPVRELPGLGHYPQVERPDLVAEALDEAIARVSA